MKKILGAILVVFMILIMSTVAFADDTADASMPTRLTASQFKVLKPAARAVSYGSTKIKVSWGKVEDVDGYRVYRAASKNGKYIPVYTTTNPDKLYYINTGRTTGKAYYYKVRAYKVIDDKMIYTKYSNIQNTYARPSKVILNKVYLPKNEQVKVTWSKVSGATGYQVYRKRADKNTWKLFKSVSSKSTAVTDKLLGNASKPFGPDGGTWYDHSDAKYIWEYKVRAYRTVNEKKVYGLFSTPKKFVPEWTIEEIYEELWQYGESLEWPMYEVVSTYPDPDKNGNYIKKTDGSTYSLKHVVGDNMELGDLVYTNPSNGNTKMPSDPSKFNRWTEKNSSWYVIWPCQFNRYEKKASLIKKLKECLYADLESTHIANPLYWDPVDAAASNYPWCGVEVFSIYYKYSSSKGEYQLWGLW